MSHRYFEMKRFHWLLFTVAFGFLPIIMRAITSGGSDSGVSGIAHTDVAFFGLMFNAVAMANVISEKHAPRVYLLVLGATSVLSISFIGAYMAGLSSGVDTAMLWLWLVFTLIVSVTLSFFTTDADLMYELQRVLDQSDQVSKLPSPLKQKAHAVLDAMGDDREGERMKLFDAVFNHYNWKLANRGAVLVCGTDENGNPTIKLNDELSPEEELHKLLAALLEKFKQEDAR